MSSLLPPSWRWATLDELLVEPLTNGRSVRTAVDGFPILRLTAIRDQRVDLTEWKTGAWTEQDAEPFLVRRGDFFIARGSGSRHLVGRGGLVREEPSRVAFPDKFIRVRTSREVVDPEYLALVWASPLVALQMHKLAKTTAGIHMVTQDDIRSCKLPLASLREQRQIVDVVDAHFSRLDAATSTLERVQRNLERYRASVLKAAVEGRLVPTEAELAKKEGRTYEPASVLLKRILTERRRRWEEAELAKLTAKGKKPTDDKWKAKYEEPAAPDVAGLPELPEGWCWATLPMLGEIDRGRSRHRPRNDPRLLGGPHPFIQTGDVRRADGFIRVFDSTYSDFGLTQSKIWPAGTLCITIAANIAETAILGFDACFPDSIVGFVNAERPMIVRFAELFLRTAREKLERFAPATAQKNINLQTLTEVAVPLPPEAEIVRVVETVDAEMERGRRVARDASRSVKCAARLRQSILKWAFEGRLVDAAEGTTPSEAPQGSDATIRRSAPNRPTARR